MNQRKKEISKDNVIHGERIIDRSENSLKPAKEIDLTVFVENAEGSEIASRLSGHFALDGQEFPFNAIAFGRIGGHNASVTLSKRTLSNIRKMGVDTDELLLTIQRKLVEGDIILPEGLKPPS